MRLLPLSELSVPTNRQRREFDPVQLTELMTSIGSHGLLQPLVVRYDEKGKASLVAGERRLRAIQDLWGIGGTFKCDNSEVDEGLIPVVSLGELSALAAFEAELEENIRRADLTFQEEAVAVARLHELRRLQNPAQSVADTAREVTGQVGGDAHSRVRQQLAVARNLDNPEVVKAKTLKEAFKIIERAEQVADNELHARAVGLTFGKHSHQLIHGDCLEVMATLPPASFDVILTDPPYGMGADGFGDAAGKLTTITHEYSDSEESFQELMIASAIWFDRLAKPAAHLYLCCDIDQFGWLKELFGQKWNVFRTPLLNIKAGGGRLPLPEHGPRRCYEIILYAYRGDKRVTAVYPDTVFTEGDDNLGHGAQKPVSLFTDLLKRSVRAGDKVLDPFAGTGTIFGAAHALRCLATGIEREANYYGIAAKRIEGLA